VTWVQAAPPEPLYPIFQDNHWGLIDASGNIILPAKFDQIGKSEHGWIPSNWEFTKLPSQVSVQMTLSSGDPVTDQVIPIRLDGKFGLATRQGEVLAFGRYEEIDWRFEDGLLKVWSGGRSGFANERGELVIPIQFDQTFGFRKDHAFVKIGGLWGVIDRTGKVIIPPIWDEVRYPLSDLAEVRLSDKWGVVDRTGKIIVPIRFDDIRGTPYNSLIAVVENGRTFYVQPDGHGTMAFELICPKKLFSSPKQVGFSFRVKSVIFKCGKHYGLIDAKGNFLLDPVWDDIGRFYDGRAIIKSGKAMGIIDEDGRFILKPSEEFNISGYYEGLAGFSRISGDSMGCFDLNGRIIFELPLQRLLSFRQGLAVARQPAKNGRPQKEGYIDKTGVWVIKARFHNARPFNGPLAYVSQPTGIATSEEGYINRKGDVIYRRQNAGFKWPDHLVDPAGIGQ
jgi:hypothetical protein